jgi:hypothetical protein
MPEFALVRPCSGAWGIGFEFIIADNLQQFRTAARGSSLNPGVQDNEKVMKATTDDAIDRSCLGWFLYLQIALVNCVFARPAMQ